jgi:hypothetical protein
MCQIIQQYMLALNVLNHVNVCEELATFWSVGIAHVVGGAIRVIVWVGCGSIDCNEFAPVHLLRENFTLIHT